MVDKEKTRQAASPARLRRLVREANDYIGTLENLVASGSAYLEEALYQERKRVARLTEKLTALETK